MKKQAMHIRYHRAEKATDRDGSWNYGKCGGSIFPMPTFERLSGVDGLVVPNRCHPSCQAVQTPLLLEAWEGHLKCISV